MTSLPLAKALLFIALSFSPKESQVIFATSNSSTYYWTKENGRWSLETKGLPTCDWTSEGVQENPVGGDDFRAIAHQRWSQKHFLDLGNGNRVEKQGEAVFYIVDPGAPNEKVYTILYPRS